MDKVMGPETSLRIFPGYDLRKPATAAGRYRNKHIGELIDAWRYPGGYIPAYTTPKWLENIAGRRYSGPSVFEISDGHDRLGSFQDGDFDNPVDVVRVGDFVVRRADGTIDTRPRTVFEAAWEAVDDGRTETDQIAAAAAVANVTKIDAYTDRVERCVPPVRWAATGMEQLWETVVVHAIGTTQHLGYDWRPVDTVTE